MHFHTQSPSLGRACKETDGRGFLWRENRGPGGKDFTLMRDLPTLNFLSACMYFQ